MDSRFRVIVLLSVTLVGCGTTKWTDTSRSATEQLLISDAMDRAVSELDFRALAGKKVYLDAEPLQSCTDSAYLISSLRQHMLASGCVLKDQETEAEYIVEARSGAVGTDHHELVYGVPRVDIPALIPVSGVGIPPNIPEIKFVTRTDQRAVVKIAVFAYNRQTGRPVWQSGVVPTESTAKNIWVFGAGPFQRGTIFGGTSFAGDKLKIPLVDFEEPDGGAGSVSIADEAYFIEPRAKLAQDPQPPAPGDGAQPESGQNAEPAGTSAEVIQTGHAQPGDPEAAGQAPPAQPPPAEVPQADSPPAENPPSQPPPLENPAAAAQPPELTAPLPLSVQRPW